MKRMAERESHSKERNKIMQIHIPFEWASFVNFLPAFRRTGPPGAARDRPKRITRREKCERTKRRQKAGMESSRVNCSAETERSGEEKRVKAISYVDKYTPRCFVSFRRGEGRGAERTEYSMIEGGKKEKVKML